MAGVPTTAPVAPSSFKGWTHLMRSVNVRLRHDLNYAEAQQFATLQLLGHHRRRRH